MPDLDVEPQDIPSNVISLHASKAQGQAAYVDPQERESAWKREAQETIEELRHSSMELARAQVGGAAADRIEVLSALQEAAVLRVVIRVGESIWKFLEQEGVKR